MVKASAAKSTSKAPKSRRLVEVNDFQQTPSFESQKNKQPLSVRLLPAVYIGLLFASFALGVIWQRVEDLQKGKLAQAQPTAVQPDATPQPVSLETIKSLFSQDLITFGNADSKLLFVEIADPSCPYCHIAGGKNPNLNKQAGTQFTLVSDGGSYIAPVSEMKKLVDQGKAAYAYIYSIGHGNGEMAQKALYCAHEKGKFWQAHDLLYSEAGYSLINDTVKNDKAKSGELAQFLSSAVDSAFIKSCLDSGKYDSRIQSDLQLSSSLGVRGTPAFFVNENIFPGAVSYTDMKSVVDQAL